MIDWFPVDARTLHRHHGTLLRHEPITERQSLGGGGARCPEWGGDLALVTDAAQAGRQGRLMPVEATTHCMDYVQRLSLPPAY